MPRAPRVFVEGAIYHVYNRVTRGERVFGDDGEAERLVDVMREVKQRDGLVVLAWCVMSNHYDLAVRCTSVLLWKSLASIQVKVAQAYNARHRVYGPFWQGRYKAKLVEDPGYLRQLVLYVHLNPVASGIVEKPEEFSWSGHREVVRKVPEPLVDPDQLLLVFNETRRAARRAYLEASLWGRRGARRRCDDGGFGRQMDELDTALAATVPSRKVTGGEHEESPSV